MRATDADTSRVLNWWLYGSPDEQFCVRLWRHRWIFWPLILWIDIEAWRRFGDEPGHCRRQAADARGRE